MKNNLSCSSNIATNTFSYFVANCISIKVEASDYIREKHIFRNSGILLMHWVANIDKITYNNVNRIYYCVIIMIRSDIVKFRIDKNNLYSIYYISVNI